MWVPATHEELEAIKAYWDPDFEDFEYTYSHFFDTSGVKTEQDLKSAIYRILNYKTRLRNSRGHDILREEVEQWRDFWYSLLFQYEENLPLSSNIRNEDGNLQKRTEPYWKKQILKLAPYPKNGDKEGWKTWWYGRSLQRQKYETLAQYQKDLLKVVQRWNPNIHLGEDLINKSNDVSKLPGMSVERIQKALIHGNLEYPGLTRLNEGKVEAITQKKDATQP